MFGPLGLPELLFILGLALLVFGPKRLPEVGRTLGKGLAEFRKASTELRRSINTELMVDEVRASDPRRLLRDEPEPETRTRRPPGLPAASEGDTDAGATDEDAASVPPRLAAPAGERVSRGDLARPPDDAAPPPDDTSPPPGGDGDRGTPR